MTLFKKKGLCVTGIVLVILMFIGYIIALLLVLAFQLVQTSRE